MDNEKSELRWGVAQRLEFIEFRLFWEGHVNRSDLMEQFGLSVNQASADLNRYIGVVPDNMVYDKSARTYVRGPDYAPHFLKPDASRYLAQLRSLADGIMDSDDTWIAELPSYDAAPTPTRGVNPVILRSVVGAIRRSEAIEVKYQSLSRPDAHQRIYGRRASMAACGIKVRGRSRRLRLNYRTTEEIRTWAVSILEGVSVDDLDEGTDTLRGYVSLLHGPAPKMVPCQSELEELEGLVEWVQALPADEILLADIGVLCSRRTDVDRVQGALRTAGIDTVALKAGTADDRSIPGVRITTMHRAKGLEFFAVAIPFLSETTFPPAGALKAAVDAADRADIMNQNRSLLHVAATRAKRALRISWSGTPTNLIN